MLPFPIIVLLRLTQIFPRKKVAPPLPVPVSEPAGK